jgi:sugar-specific transcriptional regulator TrmB
MDKILRNALATLGCDDKEIRLFLASYAHGAASLSDLAKTSRLQRSTAYVVIKSLLERGLIVEDYKSYGKSFSAVEPETLIRMVTAKQRQIGRQRLNLEEHLGELQALHGTSEIRPRVRTYQGLSGLLSVWRDILSAETEILLWSNQATESKVFSTAHHDQFISERVASGKPIRVLAVNNGEGRTLQKEDAEYLRETHLLPEGIDFTAETYIYDHKVALLDDNHDIIGIITESQPVAAAHRAMFETAWSQLG